jgi:LysR family hydrogen peroxide-inducible transcriptional activator
MKLERSLGVALFDRLGRGMALTDAGRAFLPRARRILAEVRDAESWAGRGEDEAGLLHVGAIPTIAPYLLPGALARLRSALPACDLRVREARTEELAEALLDGELDAAVMSTPPPDDRLESESFGREDLVAALPASWGFAAGSEVGPEDLRGRPAVLLEGVHCLGRQVDGFCAARGVAPRVVCRTAQVSTILGLVGLGLGYSLVPEMAAAQDDGGSRVYARVRPAGPSRPLALVWRAGRTLGRAARELLGALRGEQKARRADPAGPARRRGGDRV